MGAVQRSVATHRPSKRLRWEINDQGIRFIPVWEREEQRFALTPLGAALKTGAPGSARSTLLTLGSRWFQGSWEHIVHSLETGRTGMEKAWGMPLFDYLAQHGEEASLFSETMVGLHNGLSKPLPKSARYAAAQVLRGSSSSFATRSAWVSAGRAQRATIRGHRSMGGAPTVAGLRVTIWRSSLRCCRRPQPSARQATRGWHSR
jgi:hypothetical protein